MNKTITDLKFSKRSQGWVHVYLNQQFAFTVDLIDAAALSIGQIVDARLANRMRGKHELRSAYICAIRYLGPRHRSRREMVQYLSVRRRFGRETVNTTIERLGEEGYLNDKEFARLFVESRIRSRPRSCALLRQELSQKGIDDEVIVAVLEGVDDEYLAWRSIEKKLNQWDKRDPATFKKRMISFLQRRGFSLGVAMRAYRHALSRNRLSS
jgi:regulatory protein